jgi:hypothetical protein
MVALGDRGTYLLSKPDGPFNHYLYDLDGMYILVSTEAGTGYMRLASPMMYQSIDMFLGQIKLPELTV